MADSAEHSTDEDPADRRPDPSPEGLSACVGPGTVLGRGTTRGLLGIARRRR